MMKKLISVILSVFYLSLSSNAMVNLHYCGGELESIKINSEAQTCCCDGGVMSKSCCENEEYILDIGIDEYTALSINIYFTNFSYVVFSNFTLYNFNETELEDEQPANYNVPPPKLEPIWLMNCTFTFYG